MKTKIKVYYIDKKLTALDVKIFLKIEKTKAKILSNNNK